MALIPCPQCGQSVSDKALSCPHCGCRLAGPAERLCPECGSQVPDGAAACPQCGCPLPGHEAPQPVEVTGVKLRPKNKKLLAGAAALAVVVVAAAIALGNAQKKSAAADYGDALNSASALMLLGAQDAERCGNLIKQVWANAIYEERDDATDPYTRPNGYFVDDFNDALANLFSDSGFSAQLTDIRANRASVQEAMRALTSPPEEHQAAYEAVSELYDAYLDLTGMVVDPSGSLQTFSQAFNEADSETANCYRAMSLYLE